MPTTSGTLLTGDLVIPFTYDEATDAIMIDLHVAYDEDGEDFNTVTLVFHRK